MCTEWSTLSVTSSTTSLPGARSSGLAMRSEGPCWARSRGVSLRAQEMAQMVGPVEQAGNDTTRPVSTPFIRAY